MNQRSTLLRLASLVLLATPSFAQDPLKVAPQSYKLEFENPWVKVTRVHYPAQSKIPAHDHTETGAAYVYLNDCGPVIFKHVGLAYSAITRPETKAGSFRLYRAVKEVHEVENPNNTPSDFLRVEFKTSADSEKPLRGKFHRESYPLDANFAKLQFENAQIRITRIACAQGKVCEISAESTEPVLILSLASARLEPKRGRTIILQSGQTRWIAAGKSEVFTNREQQPVELLRFDFRTAPLASDPREKPHVHPQQ